MTFAERATVIAILCIVVVCGVVASMAHASVPATRANPIVFVMPCGSPGSLSYEGRQGAAAAWISVGGRAGQCWITEPLRPGDPRCRPGKHRVCPIP